MTNYLRAVVLTLTAIFCISCASLAQRQDRGLTCENSWNGRGDGQRHCEIKELPLQASGVVKVDGRQNGGVSIKGWDRNEILVRAKIEAQAPTESEAHALGNQVRIETAGANIYADGPQSRDKSWWSVSYEVFVPRRSDLELKAHNGGISISGVGGNMIFETTNGGVSLQDVSGKVQGRTSNGGLSVRLSGNRWEGEGLDVRTTNGGVNLVLPENYSARLETSTVNGGFNLGIPVVMQGKIDKSVSTDLGSGGATLRLTTTNGGVSVKRQ
ncbi:MAG: DUF4097 family beta strand repeat protein [Acidobacteria bacterium]|nr:DUF4097 family beta strand repeat protein [Acidobacteriota bacterium]